MKHYNKYGNKKVVIDGIEFDSKNEGYRWSYLKLLEKKGEIRNLRRQVYFEITPDIYQIIPRVGKRGQPLMPNRRLMLNKCGYYADFVYEARNKKGNIPPWRTVIEDFKGKETKEFILKRKVLWYFRGVFIHIIKSPSSDIPEDIELDLTPVMSRDIGFID